MIAFLPAADSFRLGLGDSCAAFGSDCFFDSAHLFRCASAMRARAAALIFRRLRFGGSAVAAGSAKPPVSTPRSSAVCAVIDSLPTL